MTKPRRARGATLPMRLPGVGVLLMIAGASAVHAQGAQPEPRLRGAGRHLFICAGDQARQNPDFLAVVNFDATSADYGKVIARAPLPEPGATGNEMHHIGLSADGRVVACGGLLSVLKGQKEIFFWNVSDPTKPELIAAADPPLSSITDEFQALPDGGFLVTMMGSATGHAPGRVAEFDRHLDLVAEHPANPPDDGFNPHGIAVRPEVNLMLTSDFICPATTLNAVPGNPDLRGSVRVWDLKRRQILRTIVIPNAGGTIDVKLIPGDAGDARRFRSAKAAPAEGTRSRTRSRAALHCAHQRRAAPGHQRLLSE